MDLHWTRLYRMAAARSIAAAVLLGIATAANWLAWLGWDQHYDPAPGGGVSGPYEVWQVVGLAVVQAALVVIAAHRHAIAAIAGATLGLTATCAWDWSDDASGLWALGASMVFLGILFASSSLVVLVFGLRPRAQG